MKNVLDSTCDCDCPVEITDYSDLDEEIQVIIVTGIELIGSLPPGGKKGDVLVKNSDIDFDAVWGEPPEDSFLDTTVAAGTLLPESNEAIKGLIQLTKVAKTGLLSDTKNDAHFTRLQVASITKNNTTVDSFASGADSVVTLQKLKINTPLAQNDYIVINKISGDITEELLNTNEYQVELTELCEIVVDITSNILPTDKIQIIVTSAEPSINVDVVLLYN